MSQILDALRRAEAQRSRGRVPGLHQTAIPLAQPSALPKAVQRRPGTIWLAALLVVVAGVALWLLLGRSISTRPPADLPVAVRSRADAMADSKDSMTAEIDRGLPGHQFAVEPPPASPSDVALPRQAQLPERRNEVKESTSKPMSDKAPTGAAGAALALVKPSSEAKTAIPSRQDLAADVQRTLPQIVVSGSVYSADPAQRMLVVNGELWHEGEQIRPGLVLEQIRQRDAVLRYNGLRFSVGP